MCEYISMTIIPEDVNDRAMEIVNSDLIYA